MITILLADDHTILREGLRKMLEEEPGLKVIGEAEDGFEAISKVHDLTPDILIVDLVMPKLNGLEVTQRLKAEATNLKIIVLSMRKSEPYIIEALQNGADGYVLKSEDPQDLVDAIHVVLKGKKYLNPKVASFAEDEILTISHQNKSDGISSLTKREREVLQLSVEGMKNEDIAKFFNLSIHTISTHRRNLMGKLNIRNQADLLKYAIQQGIISEDG